MNNNKKMSASHQLLNELIKTQQELSKCLKSDKIPIASPKRQEITHMIIQLQQKIDSLSLKSIPLPIYGDYSTRNLLPGARMNQEQRPYMMNDFKSTFNNTQASVEYVYNLLKSNLSPNQRMDHKNLKKLVEKEVSKVKTIGYRERSVVINKVVDMLFIR